MQLERCPNCRARLDGTAQCRRCGTELGAILDLEQARLALVDRAVERLRAGDWTPAVADLTQAQALREEELAAALRDWACHERAHAPHPDPL